MNENIATIAREDFERYKQLSKDLNARKDWPFMSALAAVTFGGLITSYFSDVHPILGIAAGLASAAIVPLYAIREYRTCKQEKQELATLENRLDRK